MYNACTNFWGKELKDLIKNRKGTLVVRPDSGDPPVIVPKLLGLLCEAFKEDVTVTSTGHKLLPPYIRMIQGDGISYESLGKILEAMTEAGYAAEELGEARRSSAKLGEAHMLTQRGALRVGRARS